MLLDPLNQVNGVWKGRINLKFYSPTRLTTLKISSVSDIVQKDTGTADAWYTAGK